MKNTNKFQSTWRGKTFSLNGRAYYRIRKIIVFSLLQCLLCTFTSIANTTSHSVDTIAEELLKAEARFTDLRLEYTEYTTGGSNRKDPNKPSRIVKAVYAQKSVMTKEGHKRLYYLDHKVFVVDPNTEQSTLVDDTMSCFDGEATKILYRKVNPDKPIKGFILAGYDPIGFPSYDMDPHTKIWYFANKGLGNILKENKNNFHIESESEVLDGISTVKLAGTISDGKFIMKLWVSPERNFLPMKSQLAKTGGERLLMGTILLDLVKLSNGLWYPKKIQSPEVPLTDPAPHHFLIYEISKISVDPIPEDFFRPEFPPDTHVIDDILKVSYTTYCHPESYEK